MMCDDSYRRTLSKALKLWWATANEEVVRDRFKQMRETNIRNGRWLADEDKKPFIAYRDKVRVLSEKTFVSHFHELPNASLRGKGYELDHVLSIYEGFKQNVPEVMMAHVLNLRMILAHDNKVKGRKSLKTPEELISEVQNED